MSPDTAQRVNDLERAQREQQQRLEAVERWQDIAQVLGTVPPGSPGTLGGQGVALPTAVQRPHGAMASDHCEGAVEVTVVADPGEGAARPAWGAGDHDGDQGSDQGGDLKGDVQGSDHSPGDESDPSSWSSLGVAQRGELWWELSGWVDWLAVTYDLHSESRMVPPCWWRHTIAVQELAALRTAWLAAHEAMALGQHTSDPAYWHDRLLWPGVQRMRALHVFGQCSLVNHVDPASSGYAQAVQATRQDPDFLALVGSQAPEPAAPASTAAAAARLGPTTSRTSTAAPTPEATPAASAAGATKAPGPATTTTAAGASATPAAPPVGADAPTAPGVLLGEAQVAALCAAGEAERLLADLASPVLVNGRWWVVLDSGPIEEVNAGDPWRDGFGDLAGAGRLPLRWGLVADEQVSHTLDQMWAHQYSAHKAVQALATSDDPHVLTSSAQETRRTHDPRAGAAGSGSELGDERR